MTDRHKLVGGGVTKAHKSSRGGFGFAPAFTGMAAFSSRFLIHPNPSKVFWYPSNAALSHSQHNAFSK